jgi:hypothetical protein
MIGVTCNLDAPTSNTEFQLYFSLLIISRNMLDQGYIMAWQAVCHEKKYGWNFT